jgi:hypothetical protein
MAPKKLSKPKGAYPKVGGIGGYKFNGKTKADKFENFMVNTVETTETRKDRFENPSRLYAGARKLGIPESKVKKQIDTLAKQDAKYGAAVEKKTSKMEMDDLVRNAKANIAAKKKAAVKKSRSYSPAPMTAAAKTKTKAAAAMKAGRMTDRALSTAKSDALKKAAKTKIQRQVGKGGPIKPMIKKLTDSSDKATKKKR